MLEQARKGAVKQTQTPLQPATTPLPQPAPDAALQRAWAIQRFAIRPATAQRATIQPVLSAIRLQRQEEERLEAQAAPLQRQIGPLSASLPSDAMAGALQRQAAQFAPLQAPARPQSTGDWVTVMRAKAQSLEQKNSGRGMNPREVAELSSLQRQTAAALAQGVRTDPRPAVQRQAAFAEHAASLHGHPLTHNIPRAAIALATPGDRPGLQRALDEALQRQEALKEQDERALELHGLQRQMAELDAQATQSVYQRIQQRRGAGSPLPEAVQRHLEHGLNHDLSAVRIHDDAEADKLAKGVNALAFTTGTDIYFRSGKFNPNTQSGLELLAHEVTHTVQQSKGQVGKGIDPDSGLEQEARAMGRKLSQRRPRGSRGHGPKFGRQPGKHTAPRPSLRQAVSAGPSGLQRWGLGDLKKLASKATSAVASGVNKVRAATTRVVASAAKRVQAVATPAIKAVRRQVSRAKAAVKRVMSKTRRVVGSAAKHVRQFARKKLKGLKRRIGRVAGKVKSLASSLKTRATSLASRARETFSKVRKSAGKTWGTVKQKVGRGVSAARSKLTRGVQAAKNYASTKVNQVKSAASRLKNGAGRALRSSVDAAKNLGAKVAEGLKSAKSFVKNSATKGWSAAKAALGKAGSALKKLPKSRPLTTVALLGGSLYAGYKGIQTLRKGGIKGLVGSIKSTATKAFNWVKSPEGIATIARVGITAAVTIGAAALTVGTGGLAAPLAIAAGAAIMGAGGAVGGAAGKLAQNAILKNVGSAENRKKYANLKYTEGINARSVAGDFVLGAALGPAGAIAGGVTRQVVGNIGRYVAKPAAKLLGSVGKSGVNLIKGTRRAANSGRSIIGSASTLPRQGLRQRITTQLRDVKAYNSGLWNETRKDVAESLYGGMGMGGKVRNPKEILGSNKKLAKTRKTAARTAVQKMGQAKVVKLARKLGIPTNVSRKKLNQKVASALVKTNHTIVEKGVRRAVRKRVVGQLVNDVKRQLVGAPRRAGESKAHRYLRGAGNLATAGFRTNLRNIGERDKTVAEQFSRGKVNGIAQFSGATANEITKMNLMSLLRTGSLLTDPAHKQILEGAVQASGGTPDMYKERAAGSWFGFDALPKSLVNQSGGGNVDAGMQFEDTPEPEGN